MENLVGIELSYINTKHPDFHDAAALVGNLLRETQAARLEQNFVQPAPATVGGARHERHIGASASESAISSQESKTGVNGTGFVNVQEPPRSPFSSKAVNLLPEVVSWLNDRWQLID